MCCVGKESHSRQSHQQVQRAEAGGRQTRDPGAAAQGAVGREKSGQEPDCGKDFRFYSPCRRQARVKHHCGVQLW